MIVDEFGQPTSARYKDWRIEFPNMQQELAEMLAKDFKLMDAMRGAVLYGPNGERLEIGTVSKVSGRAFRVPFIVKG